MDAADMGSGLKEVLITSEQLGRRTAELAAQIDADYADRDPLLVGVLKGAVMVMADLARAMHLPVQMDWMAVSSYGSGTKSSGVVRILKDLDADISGRHVLIVEDIIDSGLTLSWLVGNLKSRDPASVEICTMLRKPSSSQMDAADMGPALKEVLITQEQLSKRTTELAAQIDADYAGRELLLVGVLKGAVMVMADLARAMHLPVEMDWMAVSSYGSGTKSSGVVRILKDLDADISGRHVLIVEDIIDSGLTLSWLVSNLKSRDPASVAIAAMLRKPNSVQTDVEVAYTGFEIPDEFVVGYGLDYAERYRNLPFIGTLAPEVYGGNTSR